jgi:protein subunit release factor A
MKERPAFSINDNDISVSENGLTIGSRSRATKQSRASTVTGSTVTLTHLPTGISVTGEIAQGHYTRQKMRQLKIELKSHLLVELSSLVAQKLKK